MGDEIPQWAKVRAEALVTERVDEEHYYSDSCGACAALAAYIAAHEEEPVDPLLIEARQLAARCARERGDPQNEEWCLGGGADDAPVVQVALAALRRGMELAREKSHAA
jgi:hypothetical protein